MYRASRLRSGSGNATHSRGHANIVAAVLVFACALVALPQQTRAQSDYGALEGLLPAETVGVLTLPSIQIVQGILDGWYADFQGDTSGDESDAPNVAEEIAKLVGLEPRLLDPGRPLAAAFSLAMAGAPPMPTVVLPVRDEEATLTALEAAPPAQFSATHGSGRGYVVLTALPQYAPGLARFELPAPRHPHDVRVAFDLATLYQMYGPMLEFFLASMMQELQSGNADPGALEGTTRAAEWAREVLGNAERFEITLSTGDELVRLSSTLRSRPGSRPVVPVRDSKRVLELARVLDTDAALFGVVSADLRGLYDWAMGMQQAQLNAQLGDAAPHDTEELMTLFETSSELQRLLSGPNAYAMDLDENGIDLVHLMLLEDVSGFVDTFRDAMQSMKAIETLGFSIAEGASTKLDGVDVYTWQISFNADLLQLDPSANKSLLRDFSDIHARLFGGEAGVMRLALVDDIAVFVLHPDEQRMREVLARLRSTSGNVPALLRDIQKRHTAPLWFAGSADLMRLASTFMEAFINPEAVEHREAYAALLEGDPIPITVSSSQGDGILHGELSTDVRALAAFFEALTEAFPDDKSKSDG